MSEAENNFINACQKYINHDERVFKGKLLYKAYMEEKRNEELITSYVAAKEKFDCTQAFLLTKTRLIEINAYSTMYIVTIRKYKSIKKFTIEREFDNELVENILENKAFPERVQVKITFIDHSNEHEEILWENIEDKDCIIQAQDFVEKLSLLQTDFKD